MMRAADDLLHFIFLFVILFAIFICTAFLLLGPTFLEFSDLEKTTQSLFELLLGEVGLWAEVIDIKGYFSIHNFMLVCFLAVMFFCLLNILLAILVDAYVAVKDDAQGGPLNTSMVSDICTLGKNWWQAKFSHRGVFMSETEMIEVLDAARSERAKEIEQAREMVRKTRRVRVVDDMDLDRWELARLLLSDNPTDAEDSHKKNYAVHKKRRVSMKDRLSGMLVGNRGKKDLRSSAMRLRLVKNIMLRYGEGRDGSSPFPDQLEKTTTSSGRRHRSFRRQKTGVAAVGISSDRSATVSMSEVTVKRFKEKQQYQEIELATVGETSTSIEKSKVSSSRNSTGSSAANTLNPMGTFLGGARKQGGSSHGVGGAKNLMFDTIDTDSSGSDSGVALP